MKKFYLTTAIPYVNSRPHIGHALEFVQTDAIARYHRLLGEQVCLLSGGDENALKNVQAAEAVSQDIQSFVDNNARLFEELAKKINVLFDVFQKGSDKKTHYPSSQLLWKKCFENEDIYQKTYQGLYCVGCELFYEERELNENKECFEHPGKKLETVKEENYFFKLSKYQNQLIELISTDKLLIVPISRKNEMLSFLKNPLQDISISRSNKRAKNWGVPVPGDSSQRIYVWFDALNIYQSGVGFGWDEKTYQKWWPADLHVIGKGITRFHAIYWPAFLISAGLKVPKSLFVHGYLTIDGQKMSKTVGNVIDPLVFINKYGVDPLRYYLLREIPSYGDGDFSERRFVEIYNADLANGLGNLISRVAKLCENSGLEFKINDFSKEVYQEEWINRLKEYRFDTALSLIWLDISIVDQHVNQNEPWYIKDINKLKEILQVEVDDIRKIAFRLLPFLPETAEKILKQFSTSEIKSSEPYFLRIK
ncbi:methionine--tRNA ligase [Candidatus Roizmanbacteria bacterium RIFCSPHIGHO2_02_FULL_37_13b]|uniref:Methionine--tRNA ligase n=1 Tax=Candidatus Roizmanbacteria bacterium RIFCSPLOWO2_02_FULL_36_11 TaxID=1802071 RepID=A0A1F7JHA9_9BACT|nr:MAG: methionine--tRNA ligase [Candidatus Roizmanbacteria bacterium RIFCSPHIGHO2_02_FULL_37_13b]OGK54976.1 MAG: methionine--tRNA ligase [Candidatus Roizmanbacteria bacterium RIFCSPLOWO2_02_FULL_36_11]